MLLFPDYDSRGKTFTALCEIANEACQTWFPSQEKKWIIEHGESVATSYNLLI